MALLLFSQAMYSCAYIFGRKTKQVTVYLERDSCSLIYQKDTLSRSPFTITADNSKKTLEFSIMEGGDTYELAYKRRIRDIFYPEVVTMGLLLGTAYWYTATELDKSGRVFTYPRRMYIDPYAETKKMISLWPRERKGWTRINMGIPILSILDIDTGKANLSSAGILGITVGAEHYFRNNYSLWADIGAMSGGASPTEADYIDSTDYYASAGYYANIGVSRHFGRFSAGIGLGASRLRYIYEVPGYLTPSKAPIAIYNIGINKFNLALKLNYWIKPNSSLNFNYMPAFSTADGTGYTHIIYFGWTVNFAVRQPNRYRIDFDDAINKKKPKRKTAKSPQSSGNAP